SRITTNAMFLALPGGPAPTAYSAGKKHAATIAIQSARSIDHPRRLITQSRVAAVRQLHDGAALSAAANHSAGLADSLTMNLSVRSAVRGRARMRFWPSGKYCDRTSLPGASTTTTRPIA